ncbi:hypothetical protein FC96_GL002119 [Secundilactobacillus kimchicus JCM 15530]|uniref:N-acetyltransferase domain-containing protein n=1 Tax=Secundilactobacillus kimchicus JCM 15530 TaxID=1302272 RepID=A0A0R1HX13_9LACO|nr:hypothetical protein FC96_GL002119 [Secundilactobacillus kimchicus JCM 15530]
MEGVKLIIRNDQLTEADYNQIADIWLADNLKSHQFIEASYWQEHLETAVAAFPKANLYVEKTDGQVRGFLGMTGDAIEGLFVAQTDQRQGVGQALMEAAKAEHDVLTLQVYWKNHAALKFYLAQEFKVDDDHVEEATKQAVYDMVWRKNKDNLHGFDA